MYISITPGNVSLIAQHLYDKLGLPAQERAPHTCHFYAKISPLT